MKTTILVVLFIFSIQYTFSQNSILYDTIFIENDQKEIIYSEGILNDGLKTGIWKSWYSNGQLRDSGAYTIIPKNEILLVYEDIGIIIDTNDLMSKLNNHYENKIGLWKTYNKVGVLIEQGIYLNKAQIILIPIDIINENDEKSTVFSIGNLEPMKTGRWEYLNEINNMTIIENYLNGILIKE